MTARLRPRLLLLAIVAIAAGLVAALALRPRAAPPPPATENATVLVPPKALPPLNLIDQDGQAFTAQSLQGRWSYVFFGFTYCPDVCPATLAMLKRTRERLADLPEAQQPRALLVTVDPERDTAERLRDYVRYFDPSFGAATGTPDDIAAAAGGFGVPYAKVELPEGGYTMDHGSGLFLVSPDGRIAAYASPPFAAEVLERDFRKVLAHYEATRA